MPTSLAQYLEMQRRTEAARRKPEVGGEFDDGGFDKKNAVAEEGDLHDEIIEECKNRGWLYFHSSMAARTRRTNGEPDFHIWADAGRKFAFECKSKSGKLSTAQLGVIAHAKKLGHTVHVIGNKTEFLGIVDESGKAS